MLLLTSLQLMYNKVFWLIKENKQTRTRDNSRQKLAFCVNTAVA